MHLPKRYINTDIGQHRPRTPRKRIRNFDSVTTTAAKWITTDHSEMATRVNNLQGLSLAEGIAYLLAHIIVAVLGAVFTALWAYVLIRYGIPLFLFGHL